MLGHEMNAPRAFDLTVIGEDNGFLIPFELSRTLNWNASRVFFVAAEAGSLRGQHAHRKCRQAVIAAKGVLSIFGQSVLGPFQFLLENPHTVLEIPTFCWASEKFLTDGLMLVLAEMPYDEGDYIRNFDDYLMAIKSL